VTDSHKVLAWGTSTKKKKSAYLARGGAREKGGGKGGDTKFATEIVSSSAEGCKGGGKDDFT